MFLTKVIVRVTSLPFFIKDRPRLEPGFYSNSFEFFDSYWILAKLFVSDGDGKLGNNPIMIYPYDIFRSYHCIIMNHSIETVSRTRNMLWRGAYFP